VFFPVYHFLWTSALLPLLPFAPLVKHRHLGKRLASGIPPTACEGRPVWIHALSVGEVISAIPLIREIRERRPDLEVVLTVTTRQGLEIAEKELQAEVKELLVMPLDFWLFTARISNHIRPRVFVIIETDLWPGIIHYLNKKGIKTVLVNGRISPRTFTSYKKYNLFTREIFKHIDKCLMQTQIDTHRLREVGIDSSKVRTVGNIKFDRDWVPMDQQERNHLLELLHISPEDWVLAAGSIHEGEGEILLDIFKKLQGLFPRLRLVLAPRKLEHSPDLLKRCREKGLSSVLRTELQANHRTYDVVIINTMGELARLYGVAKLSFVGGSLVPVGGHNLLEPASFGIPVVFGPHVHNFLLMSEQLIETGGGKKVRNAQELFHVFRDLLANQEKLSRMGENAKAFVEMNRGAIGKVMEVLKSYL